MDLLTLQEKTSDQKNRMLRDFIDAPADQNFGHEVVAMYLGCSPWTLARMRCEVTMGKHIETVKLFGSSLKSAVIENCETTIDSVQSIGEGVLGLLKVLGDTALRLIFLVLIIIALPFVTWLRIKAEQAHKRAIKKASQEYMDRMTRLQNKRDASD